MCLNETCSRVRVGKRLSDRNGLKEGDASLPLLFNLALDYAISRVPVNQDALKLNGTCQISVYGDYGNILGGSVHTIKKKQKLC